MILSPKTKTWEVVREFVFLCANSALALRPLRFNEMTGIHRAGCRGCLAEDAEKTEIRPL
jgi:hypothetical protein